VNRKTGITETFTTIAGLKSNTAYTFQISTQNIAGSGATSAGTTLLTGDKCKIFVE